MEIPCKSNVFKNESLGSLATGHPRGLGRGQFRPADRSTFCAVAIELAGRGLRAADIADALGLTDGAVRDLLRGASS